MAQQPPAAQPRRDRPGFADGPNRSTNARAATPITATASANAPPAGATAPSSTSSANAHREKCARITSASRPNRRNQPRTVSVGTPSRSAIGRCPSPPARADERRADHRDDVTAPQQTRVRQQHMRRLAAATLRAPRPQPPKPANQALARVAPWTQPALTGRATAACHRADRPRPSPRGRLPSAPGATSAFREPSRRTAKLETGGLSRVNERANPARHRPERQLPPRAERRHPAVPVASFSARVPTVSFQPAPARADRQLRSTPCRDSEPLQRRGPNPRFNNPR